MFTQKLNIAKILYKNNFPIDKYLYINLVFDKYIYKNSVIDKHLFKKLDY